jgi:tRNA-modifying protein YgfZ
MKPVAGVAGREYRSALQGSVWIARSHRARLRMEGRAPGRMLAGLVTGSIPPALESGEDGVLRGRAFPSAVLTPKGKIVAEVRLHRLGNGEEGGFLLDMPAAGLEALRDHFQRYLPPRFAKASDVSGETRHLTVVGPAAAGVLADLLGAAPDAGELAGLAEGEERVTPGGLRVVRNRDVDPPAFDLIGEQGVVAGLEEHLREAQVVEGDGTLWDVLRVERGRPVFGRELDEGVIPPEAGLQDRWVDHQKGCYTGQEVIVRIRDRGRVNRNLRGILLGEGRGAEPGVPLYVPGRDRPAGELRSVVASPRFGQVAALAYVRREVEPPGEVHVGDPQGPRGQVRALAAEGWELVPGDPGA